MKFIIWGSGRRGRMAYEALTKNQISYFVDSDIELQGRKINGLKIISPEKMLECYEDEMVIITPRDYEEEIAAWLEKQRINRYLRFSVEMMSLPGFIKQVPRDALFREIDFGHKMFIFGENILAYCIQNWLAEKNVNAVITERIRDISDKSIVILSKEIDEKTRQQIQERTDKVLVYYNLSLQKEYYYNDELTKFCNIHQGERCFIVGTGPSLCMRDLDILSEYHEKCISMNGIFKAFPYTSWKPDYYCLSDPFGWQQWKQEILSMSVNEKFIADTAWEQRLMGLRNDFHKWHMYLTWQDGCEPEYSIDLPYGFFWGKTITFECCIPLAMYMGFKEIILIGVDCTQYAKEEQQHFVPDYNIVKSKGNRLFVDDIILSYKSAKRYADAHGIKIYNATRGGKLEVFERVDFDSLFE